MITRPILMTALLSLIPVKALYAEPTPYSSSLTGPLGLNVIPSARMAESGTLTLGLSTLDPYVHGYLGMQLSEPIYINIRQSAETSSLMDEPDRLYPGIDMKLRLIEEGRYRPEMSVGLQSLIGHKRMSGEYLAFSKRYKSFDFTAGLGWGRYGTAAHIDNPLKTISSHFGKSRSYDDELSVQPQDWFTGEKIGIFGGVEYFTPMQGVSLKLDIGADRYSAEAQASDFNKAAPWAIGFNFRPVSAWFDAGVALMGTDKIMARINFNTQPSNWKTAAAKIEKPPHMRGFRTGLSLPPQMEISARNDGILLYDTKRNGREVIASLELNDYQTTPKQLAAASIHMANHAGKDVETITIRPARGHIKGPYISVNRRDLENALTRNQGSAEEIWMNTEFNIARSANAPTSPFTLNQYKPDGLHFILDNKFSLSEKDSGILYRTSLISEMQGIKLLGLLKAGTALRLNLSDNLERLEEIRPQSILPVRGNVADFANSTLSLERSYIGLNYSLTPELHTSLASGYLEEMYGGFGGEILYRPFGKNWAIGAESWLVAKRDAQTMLDLGFTMDQVLSGHINAWYNFPQSGLTAKAKFGRYLAADSGITLGLEKRFINGVLVEGFTTITNKNDYDIFGGTTNAYSGMRMTIPFGHTKYLPAGSAIRLDAEPLGRDYGQTLDKPIDLYRETEPLSQQHIARHWHDFTQ